MTECFDSAADSYHSWLLGVKAAREKLIRSGTVKPDPSLPDELRWAKEGERPNNQLDTITGGVS